METNFWSSEANSALSPAKYSSLNNVVASIAYQYKEVSNYSVKPNVVFYYAYKWSSLKKSKLIGYLLLIAGQFVQMRKKNKIFATCCCIEWLQFCL